MFVRRSVVLVAPPSRWQPILVCSSTAIVHSTWSGQRNRTKTVCYVALGSVAPSLSSLLSQLAFPNSALASTAKDLLPDSKTPCSGGWPFLVLSPTTPTFTHQRYNEIPDYEINACRQH